MLFRSATATTSTTTYVSTVISKGGTGDVGTGAGGGGGGTAPLNTGLTTNTGRASGSGGKSYVPTGFTRTAGGGGAGGSGGTPNIGKTGIYYTTLAQDPDDNDSYSTEALKYLIGEGSNAPGTDTWTWTNVELPAGKYIVHIEFDALLDGGYIIIDKKIVLGNDGQSRYGNSAICETTFTVADNWDKRIILCCTYQKNVKYATYPTSASEIGRAHV